jgi:hypothetical protein
MLDCGADFKVGDPRPTSWFAWEDWCEVHDKAGLKQESCNTCGLWFWPHELSPTVYKTKAIRETMIARRKHFEPVILHSRRCLSCASKPKTLRQIVDKAKKVK